MNKNTLFSIIESIDSLTDVCRHEISGIAKEGRYYPVAQDDIIIAKIDDGHRVTARPYVPLKRVDNGKIYVARAYEVLSPVSGEDLDSYLGRLVDYLDYLDDHALFVEL